MSGRGRLEFLKNLSPFSDERAESIQECQLRVM